MISAVKDEIEIIYGCYGSEMGGRMGGNGRRKVGEAMGTEGRCGERGERGYFYCAREYLRA